MAIQYTTGNLLKSKTEALVNTVNCEGYMGKGIAYQFKLAYPLNNEDYIKACKSGKLTIGHIHYFREKNKLILNFPTKDKWRAKSKIEYIEKGLDHLIQLIKQLNIKSISIPPLGSGNGGLKWIDVKKMIENKLLIISNNVDIYIYEPSNTNYITSVQKEPKLSLSALILMKIKSHLDKFSSFRLQKTAFFVNLFSKKDYFKFTGYKYGPYAHSIEIISRNIREFQTYHNVKNTKDAYNILYHKLISKRTDNTIADFDIFIQRACNFVNDIPTTHDLECISTVAFIIKNKPSITENEIIANFKNWSEHKSKEFSNEEILSAINYLYNKELLSKDIIGYYISI